MNARSDGIPHDVDREFVTVFMIFSMVTADMKADNESEWMFHCHSPITSMPAC